MLKQIIFMMAAAILCAGTTQAATTTETCINYLNANDYQKALDYGKKAVEEDSRNPDAHSCLGRAYSETGKVNDAIEELKEAENLTTEKARLIKIYGSLAIAYGRKGARSSMEEYAERQIELSKELDDAEGESDGLNSLGLISLSKKKYDKAIGFFQDSFKAKPATRTLSNISQAYTAKKECDKAIEYAKKAIEMGDQKGDQLTAAYAAISLSNAYLTAGNISEGEAAAQDALKRMQKLENKGGEAEATIMLAVTYMKKDDLKVSKQYLVSAKLIHEFLGNKKEVEQIEGSIKGLEKIEKSTKNLDDALNAL